MTILQANKFFYERGGSERYLFALSAALESRGHEVLHFAMAHPRNLPSPQSRHFVSQREYEGAHNPLASASAALSFVRSREAARRIDELVAERRPDVAHLHNIYHQLTPSIIEALAARGIPAVMTLHDYKLVCPSYTMFAHGAYCYRCKGGNFHQAVAVGCAGSRARAVLLAAEAYWQKWTRVYDRVDCFLAPSEYLRGIMVAAGVAPERVVHVPQLSPATPRSAALSAGDIQFLDRLPARFVVYVGRLSPEKGIDVLLDAVSRSPDVPLVVFGEGPQAPALQAMVRERGMSHVVFAGHASRAVVDAALERSVALVVPSLWAENAPMVVLEAAAAGTPVIVSDRGGLPELAARTGGCVVAADDARALSAAILESWENPSHGRARAAEAWARHRDVHEADAHLRAVESTYQNAIARGRVAA